MIWGQIWLCQSRKWRSLQHPQTILRNVKLLWYMKIIHCFCVSSLSLMRKELPPSKMLRISSKSMTIWHQTMWMTLCVVKMSLTSKTSRMLLETKVATLMILRKESYLMVPMSLNWSMFNTSILSKMASSLRKKSNPWEFLLKLLHILYLIGWMPWSLVVISKCHYLSIKIHSKLIPKTSLTLRRP